MHNVNTTQLLKYEIEISILNANREEGDVSKMGL